MELIKSVFVTDKFINNLTKALKRARITELHSEVYFNNKRIPKITYRHAPAERIYNKYLRPITDDRFHIVQRALNENGLGDKTDHFMGVGLDSPKSSVLKFEFLSRTRPISSAPVNHYTVDGKKVAKAMANYLKNGEY